MRYLCILLALAAAGCGGTDEPTAVSGPLCAQLPSGDDPGAPASLRDEPADVALSWIPVVTTFEAAARASGMSLDGTTILAPTDDAFAKAYGRQELDELLLERPRELVEAHIVEGERSLSDLLDAGEVTTRAGDTLEIADGGRHGAARRPRHDGLRRLRRRQRPHPRHRRRPQQVIRAARPPSAPPPPRRAAAGSARAAACRIGTK